jgi:ferrous iron transport protein B
VSDTACLRTTFKLALVGNPNSGKSALFNALTGARQKVANYPGVTVERRAGRLIAPDHHEIDIIDLPGTYSLSPKSPDEEITKKALIGELENEAVPDRVICVVDATNLSRHLQLVLEVKDLGIPMVVVLNMMDMAKRDRIEIDVARLSSELGVTVIPTVAVRRKGLEDLLKVITAPVDPATGPDSEKAGSRDRRALNAEARRIAKAAILSEGMEHRVTRAIDNIVLHKLAGPLVLFGFLFLIFQAVFSWAETPMEWIDSGVIALQDLASTYIPNGALKSLIVDGVLAGVGSVIIFLPQILILFAFILVLEATGYMARAAFIMDRLMASVGLNGRSFIPLLSSFACAIPGMMAARTISHERDRLTTILIAPLMTCSARLPVYTLIIAAFIPNTKVMGGFGLQGLVMFILYLAGVVSALIIAAVLKRTVVKGVSQPLIMELPKYQLPTLRDMALGLAERAWIFLRRAGRIILAVTIALWALASYPNPPADAVHPDVFYSFAGWLGRALSVLVEPIGFNWEISIALVPGMAAREVAVAALGTVYALNGTEEVVANSLATTLQSAWSLPTALAFLAWYVFAPQCLSTIAVARRETNSLGWTAFMVGYLFAIAYIAAFITYHVASALV